MIEMINKEIMEENIKIDLDIHSLVPNCDNFTKDFHLT